MKVVILAGGFGTRLSEETYALPKPMVQIGGKPILWHIMKYYSTFGFREFVICLGYKGNVIKEYFYHYWLQCSDVRLKMSRGKNGIEICKSTVEDWDITLVDTGLDAQTGLRIKRVQDYIGREPFMLTYGDGVGDVDLHALLKQHEKNGDILTLTAVRPKGRFGIVEFDEDSHVTAFHEKRDDNYINAGFMVAEPELFDILGENVPLEMEPMEQLVQKGTLGVYRHQGFWKCMDTLSDLNMLEEIWNSNEVPWKVWE